MFEPMCKQRENELRVESLEACSIDLTFLPEVKGRDTIDCGIKRIQSMPSTSEMLPSESNLASVLCA